jgi:fatty acid desaturase
MTQDGKALRSRFNKLFQDMSRKNSRLEAMATLVLEGLSIAFATALGILAWGISVGVFVPVYILAVFFVGMRLRCLGNIIHECSHSSFVSVRTWNDAVGGTLSILLFYSFKGYRGGHLTHHLYTGDYDKDQDFADTRIFEFHEELTLSRWRRYLRPQNITKAVTLYSGREFLDPSEAGIWKALRWIYSLGLVTALIGAVFLNPIALAIVAFWIVPLALTLPVIGYLSDIMDHAGLLHNDTDIRKSRNYFVNSTIIQWLLFPRNDSYHLFHHLFPAVPTRDFPKCHRILLLECPEYAARRHTLREWVVDFRHHGTSAPAV